MDLASGQNAENSNQTDTSNKLYNVARGPLDSAGLVSISVASSFIFIIDFFLLMLTLV